MKVLVVTQYFWPENFRINDLVDGLVVNGHEVTILTGIPNYPEGKVFTDFKKKSSNYNHFKESLVVRVPMVTRGKSNLKLFFNYISFALSASFIGPIKLRGKKFDVIFCCQLSPVTVGIPAIVLSKFKNAPLILWVLDLWPETLEALDVISSSLVLNVIRRLVSMIYNRCDLVLAQSRSFIRKIQDNSNNKRIEYFPSWSESIFDNLPLIQTSLGKKNSRFNILFAGNVGEAQDFPAILQAAILLKNNPLIHWNIVGDGRMLKWLEEQISKNNLTDSFTIMGHLPLEQMPKIYNSSDVLLVSLKDEEIFSMTIPGKLQSYLLAGKPIIGMINGEGAKVISDSGCGIVVPAGDSVGLASAAINISQKSEYERKLMGNKAIIKSKAEFNRTKLISKLEDWMSELLIK